MRKFSKTFSVGAFALALTLAGCSASGSTASNGTTGSGSASGTQIVTAASISEDTHYDADDLTWDAAKEVAVTLKDGGTSVAANATGVKADGDTVTITAAGTYRLSGTLGDGQVVIAAGEEDVVRVILDGVTLSSSTGSPFTVRSANEAILFLEEGSTNAIKDAAAYTDQGTDAPNAALYSMADLTVAGSGSLDVTGQYNDGIVSKDGLVLAAGNVTVKAADDGIRGKDYAVLLDGTYSISAGGDGFTSDNDTDPGRGWLLVNGGKLTAAGDDGVKAQNQLAIANGSVTVSESAEGLESQHIVISGGAVTVTASDDGVNASGDASAATQGGGGMGGGPGGGETVGDYSVDISGGSLTINSDGDGLDSNGNASVSGGTVVVNGPESNGNGALDVNGELAVSGGTVAAAGSAGMVVTPGTSSTQSGVQVTFASTVPAGSTVQLADADGKLVATFVTAKATASLVFSSSGIEAGKQYTVYTGGTAKAESGLGEGSLDGATKLGTVTAGEYTQGHGPGGR